MLDTTIKKHIAINAPASVPVVLDDRFSEYPALSWEEYTEQYVGLLRGRYAKSPMPFISILEAQRRVLACYCTDGFPLALDAGC